jgi:hypothetical protein
VPRYGETVIRVPVTLSAWGVVRQAMGLKSFRTMKAVVTHTLHYELKGKLENEGASVEHFATKGELDFGSKLKKLLD